MSDVSVTVFGYVGGQVEFVPGNGAADRAVFRIGSTPRYFDRGTGTWREQETVWLTVKCFRTLAHNVSSSIEVGQPVVVIGRLKTSAWTSADGERHTRQVLEATTVGHDLAKGTAAFLRNARSAEPQDTSIEDREVIDRVEADSALPSPGEASEPRIGAA